MHLFCWWGGAWQFCWDLPPLPKWQLGARAKADWPPPPAYTLISAGWSSVIQWQNISLEKKEMSDLRVTWSLSPQVQRWLGVAAALLQQHRLGWMFVFGNRVFFPYLFVISTFKCNCSTWLEICLFLRSNYSSHVANCQLEKCKGPILNCVAECAVKCTASGRAVHWA